MTPQPQLPARPSELLRLAVRDTKRTHAEDGYEVDMGFWVFVDDKPGSEICAACAAGSIMLWTLGLDEPAPAEELDPLNVMIHPDDRFRLYAIDRFRSGKVGVALNYMPGIVAPDELGPSIRWEVPTFYSGIDGWAKGMLDMADRLATYTDPVSGHPL